MKVELLGPSAIGKSTLSDALSVKHGTENWTFQSQCLADERAAESALKVENWRFVGDQFDYGSFIANCIRIVAEGTFTPYQKLTVFRMMNEDLRRKVLSRYCPNYPCSLEDERLLHRGFGILMGSSRFGNDAA